MKLQNHKPEAQFWVQMAFHVTLPNMSGPVPTYTLAHEAQLTLILLIILLRVKVRD